MGGAGLRSHSTAALWHCAAAARSGSDECPSSFLAVTADAAASGITAAVKGCAPPSLPPSLLQCYSALPRYASAWLPHSRCGVCMMLIRPALLGRNLGRFLGTSNLRPLFLLFHAENGRAIGSELRASLSCRCGTNFCRMTAFRMRVSRKKLAHLIDSITSMVHDDTFLATKIDINIDRLRSTVINF